MGGENIESENGEVSFKVGTLDRNGNIVIDNDKNYIIKGQYQTAKALKSDGLEVLQKIFIADKAQPAPTPTVSPTKPSPSVVPTPVIAEKWKSPNHYMVGEYVEYNELYYKCVQEHNVAVGEEKTHNPQIALGLWHRTNSPDKEPLLWDATTYYAIDTIVKENGKLYKCIDEENNFGFSPSTWAPFNQHWVVYEN